MSQTAANAPDVQQLAQQSLPETAFPGGRNQAFRVFLAAAAHEAVWKHATETSGVEICGVLVGKWAKDADGPFVLVSDCIRGEAAANKFAEVTFTHETWAKINEQMDSRFADLSIVGWYHSHPDFGVFLSDRDVFIQQNFFSEPGQIALVVDPVRKTEGVFFWQKGKPALAPYCWVGDRLRASTAAGAESAGLSSVAPVAGGQTVGPPAAEITWLPLGFQVAFGLVLFLLGCAFAAWLNRGLSDAERFRIKQDALAWSLVHLNARPGLDKDLDKVREDLDDAGKGVRVLAARHVALENEKEATAQQWNEVLRRLSRSVDRLTAMRTMYTLLPEEVEALLRILRAKELPEPELSGKKEKAKKDGPAGNETKDAAPKDGKKDAPGKDSDTKKNQKTEPK